MRAGFPRAVPGQAVGLLGGSFDPPHAGHVHITREALKRFGLDRVWWLVSPGNPLKREGPAPLARRMAAARAAMRHPRVEVTDIEARIGTRYTAETLARLVRLYPGVRFVWLMGADNLAQFHRWERWEEIMASVPVGVIARPGDRAAARTARAAERFWRRRVPERASRRLPGLAPPAWCYVNVPMRAISSSAIRARGGWTR
ncbi:MAG: nicotinate-nucleotide adenylyltransferase [Rhodobacteraceae bacterium]|nr:nicotinate-nucleotide adenylyltransferase [Paracoccaceae bacterium]